MLLVQSPHGGAGGRDHVVDKEEEGILWAQVNPFADKEVKLAHSEVRGHKVFLLVKVANSSFRSFLQSQEPCQDTSFLFFLLQIAFFQRDVLLCIATSYWQGI